MQADPIVIVSAARTPMGGRRGYGPTHSQSLEKLLLGVPGIVVVAPSECHDVGGMLADAEGVEGVGDDARDRQIAKPLVVRRDDEPGGVGGAGAAQHVLVGLLVSVPVFSLLVVGGADLPVAGRIVEALLGVRMPRRLPAPTSGDETLFARIKDALTDIRTWSSMAYLLLMLPLGVVYFTIAVTGVSLSLGLTGGALWGLVTGHSHIQVMDVPWLQHLVNTAPGLALLALLGVLLFFVVLHVARGVGWLHGRIAELLLVRL